MSHGQQLPTIPSSNPDEELYQRMASTTLSTTTTTSPTTPVPAPLTSGFSPTAVVPPAKALPDASKVDAVAMAKAVGSSGGKQQQRSAEEQILEKQQIYAELQKVERELQQRMEVQRVLSEGLEGQSLDGKDPSQLSLPAALPGGIPIPISTAPPASETGSNGTPGSLLVENSAAGVDPPVVSVAGVVSVNSGNQTLSPSPVPPHLQPLPPSVSDGEESGYNDDDLALDTRVIRIVSLQQEDKDSISEGAEEVDEDVRQEPLGCEVQTCVSEGTSVAPPAYEMYNTSTGCHCTTAAVSTMATVYNPALNPALAGIPAAQLAGHTPILLPSAVPAPLPDVQTLLNTVESSATQVDPSSLAEADADGAVDVLGSGSAINVTNLGVSQSYTCEVHRGKEFVL